MLMSIEIKNDLKNRYLEFIEATCRRFCEATAVTFIKLSEHWENMSQEDLCECLDFIFEG